MAACTTKTLEEIIPLDKCKAKFAMQGGIGVVVLLNQLQLAQLKGKQPNYSSLWGQLLPRSYWKSFSITMSIYRTENVSTQNIKPAPLGSVVTESTPQHWGLPSQLLFKQPEELILQQHNLLLPSNCWQQLINPHN